MQLAVRILDVSAREADRYDPVNVAELFNLFLDKYGHAPEAETSLEEPGFVDHVLPRALPAVCLLVVRGEQRNRAIRTI